METAIRYGNRTCGAPEGELGVGLMGLDAFSCECCQALLCIVVEVGPRLCEGGSGSSDAVFDAE